MDDSFPTLTSRLHFIKLCADNLKNIEIWNCLSVFENHVYGVISQHRRISESLEKQKNHFLARPKMSSTQVRLDIYYYTLTWDKLLKIFVEFKRLMNNIQRTQNSISSAFKADFKEVKRRMDHLLQEFHSDVRDEYEHPSLKPKRLGNIMEWGSLFEDSEGNIKVHVGKEQFAMVRKKHIEMLMTVWIDLVDTFVKHFTGKPVFSEVLQVKGQIENNIDALIDTYKQFRTGGKNEEANAIISQLIMSDIYLTNESVPLAQDVKDKIYSVFQTKVGS